MRRILLILLLIACAGCATMDPAAKRTLNTGGFLLDVGLGALSLVSGDPVSAAVCFGMAGAGAAGTIAETDWKTGSSTDPNIITEYIPPHKRADQ